MEQIGLIGYGSMADMIARQLLKHEQIKENELFIETRTKGERLGHSCQIIQTYRLIRWRIGQIRAN